nr:uncharacterized protein LOC104095516 [Nicotiana tomentosiformis]
MADALSRKAEILGSLTYLPVAERPLVLDVQDLANQFVRLDISEPSWVIKQFDAIWVIVDRLTRSGHFIPVVTTYSSEKLAQVYIREIVRLHGVPESGVLMPLVSHLRIPGSQLRA